MKNRERIASREDIEKAHRRVVELRKHCFQCETAGNPQFRHFRLIHFVQKLIGTYNHKMDF